MRAVRARRVARLLPFLLALVPLAGCGDDGTVHAHERPSGPPAWVASFESGDFREWSYTGQQDEPVWGDIAVVNPSNEGLSAHGGQRVGRFEVTPEGAQAGHIHAKVYEHFHRGDSDDNRRWRVPKDISGVYTAWFWLPKDYSVAPGTSVNVFQFKDAYWLAASRDEARSDPAWYVELKSAASMGVESPRPDAPVAVLKYWNDYERYPEGDFPGERRLVPLGRWFEMEFVVDQGKQIEFLLDGHTLATGKDEDYPVGPAHEFSFEWIFGVGHYSADPGVLYVDDVSYTPS